jgi:hypothetical protein
MRLTCYTWRGPAWHLNNIDQWILRGDTILYRSRGKDHATRIGPEIIGITDDGPSTYRTQTPRRPR